MLADLFRGTWWSERAEAVSGVVEAVFAAEDQKREREDRSFAESGVRWRNRQRLGTLLGTPGYLTSLNRM
jgi:hypothetical protein